MSFHDQTALKTGIGGLDHVLCGGLPPERLYLVEGTPGAGKTTLALRFLLQGAAQGERGLYITLSETVGELKAAAASHDWSLDQIDLFELVGEDEFGSENEQTLLHPSEVELGETVRGIIAQVEAVNPHRVVLDSLSELRMLAQSSLRYRRQILALKHFFAKRNCTVIMLDDKSVDPGDLQLHSIAHGVIALEQNVIDFGSERRRLRIVKMRGLQYRGGFHDFTIERGGLQVYPRLIAAEHSRDFSATSVTTGLPALDSLLGGGLVPGTNTLLTGPAGVGKTSTAIRCMLAALERGEKAAIYLFDERLVTLKARSAALGMVLEPYLDNGQLIVRQIDPAELAPGEFAAAVQHAVEEVGVSFVVIDSLNAYLRAVPSDTYLLLQMHELLSYLSQQGVVAMIILAMHGLTGDLRVDVDMSYLSDTLLVLRYFEVKGAVHKSIAVIKTRTAFNERTIRELTIDPSGISIGEPLTGFTGVLSGQPIYTITGDGLVANA